MAKNLICRAVDKCNYVVRAKCLHAEPHKEIGSCSVPCTESKPENSNVCIEFKGCK